MGGNGLVRDARVRGGPGWALGRSERAAARRTKQGRRDGGGTHAARTHRTHRGMLLRYLSPEPATPRHPAPGLPSTRDGRPRIENPPLSVPSQLASNARQLGHDPRHLGVVSCSARLERRFSHRKTKSGSLRRTRASAGSGIDAEGFFFNVLRSPPSAARALTVAPPRPHPPLHATATGTAALAGTRPGVRARPKALGPRRRRGGLGRRRQVRRVRPLARRFGRGRRVRAGGLSRRRRARTRDEPV